MDDKFQLKCCKKDFNYYCCVVCSGIFHPSCLNRDWKNHEKIEKHRIYCTKKCQEKDTEEEDRLRNLDLINQKLKESIKKKDSLIEEN